MPRVKKSKSKFWVLGLSGRRVVYGVEKDIKDLEREIAAILAGETSLLTDYIILAKEEGGEPFAVFYRKRERKGNKGHYVQIFPPEK